MAKSGSFFKPSGTIDGISFYKLGEIIVMRRAWGPDKKRIKKDPHYRLTRMNNSEFAACTKAGSRLRQVLEHFVERKQYPGLCPRMMKAMLGLRDLDVVSVRGDRHPWNGLKTVEGKALLCGFSFNASLPLSDVLLPKPAIDMQNRQVIFPKFLAKRDVKFPKGASHVRLRASVVLLTAGKLPREKPKELLLSKKAAAQDLVFEFSAVPEGQGTWLFVLGVDFLQEVKGDLLTSSKEEGSCLGIVAVDEVV